MSNKKATNRDDKYFGLCSSACSFTTSRRIEIILERLLSIDYSSYRNTCSFVRKLSTDQGTLSREKCIDQIEIASGSRRKNESINPGCNQAVKNVRKTSTIRKIYPKRVENPIKKSIVLGEANSQPCFSSANDITRVGRCFHPLFRSPLSTPPVKLVEKKKYKLD